jgi:hypothetical protein
MWDAVIPECLQMAQSRSEPNVCFRQEHQTFWKGSDSSESASAQILALDPSRGVGH